METIHFLKLHEMIWILIDKKLTALTVARGRISMSDITVAFA